MDDLSLYFDDISSIESSSRRERKYSEEKIAYQGTVIKSLTYAVQRLAETLETKEVELQTTQAKFKMTNRADVDLESKVLDLMIENAELKNRVTDLQEGATPTSQHWKDHRTPATSDDFSSFQREATVQGRHVNKENDQNATRQSRLADSSKTAHVVKPCLSRQRSSGLAFSKFIPRNLTPGIGGRSLFTNLERKRLSWGKRGISFPKVMPRYISTFTENFSDDMSDSV